MDEDRGTVLIPDVPTLPVQLRRIVLAPEDVEQLAVGDPLGVERDLHDLGMAGRVRADVLVGRVPGVPAGVADARPADALELPERRLDTPEAAGAERGLVLHYSSSRFSAAELMQ